MTDEKRIKILVISKSPWADYNAIGNTLSNFFGDWNRAEFHNIYCREELPQNEVCSGYYNITEKQIIRNIFTPAKVGRAFGKSDINMKKTSEDYSKTEKREKDTIDFFRSKKSKIFFIAREFIWKTGSWHNGRLNNFLNDLKPDIIFVFAAGPVYLQNIANYAKKTTGAKLVLFFADDIYSYNNRKLLDRLYKSSIRRAIRKSVKNSAKLYGASQKLCDEYEQYFGRKIEPLYKGCSFEQFGVKDSVGKPLKIVYAGNLFYGRWKILGSLADEIEKINRESKTAVLEVYTTTSATPEIDKALNKGESSKIMGARPYEEIKNILAKADIVLHAESFEEEAVKLTRLSFSTKIIDCMQSGSCIMAIGPGCLASIDYLQNIDGAIVVTDLAKTGETLAEIVRNPDSLIKKAKMLRQYAEQHHNIKSVREKLQNDFEKLANNRDGTGT